MFAPTKMKKTPPFGGVYHFIGEKVGAALTHEIRDEIFDIEEEENVSNTSSSTTANAVNNHETEEGEENEND